MVHRIADGLGQRLGKFLELLAAGRIAGDEALVHTVCAHQPPFVVIAAEPNFGNIVKPFVFQNLFFRKVAMIVENRHTLCVSFVKFYRRFVFKKKSSFK